MSSIFNELKGRKMTARDFLTQEMLDKLQCEADDNNGIIDEGLIVPLMEMYSQEQVKNIEAMRCCEELICDHCEKIATTVLCRCDKCEEAMHG